MWTGTLFLRSYKHPKRFKHHITRLDILFSEYYCEPMKRNSEFRDLFPGALELMILKSLSWRPMHGYALAQRLRDISQEYLQIEEGSLYPALQRMLKAGWLETEMGLSARNRRVRIFRVTHAGKKHLKHELASVEKMFTGVSRVLALALQ
jgi:PadR family transcriptional regulator, regulatory protein PadR